MAPDSPGTMSELKISGTFGFLRVQLPPPAPCFPAGERPQARQWRRRHYLALRRVSCEDEVPIFALRVTGEAGLELCAAVRHAVGELTEPPAAGRRIFLGVLDHELHVC